MEILLKYNGSSSKMQNLVDRIQLKIVPFPSVHSNENCYQKPEEVETHDTQLIRQGLERLYRLQQTLDVEKHECNRFW